MKTKILIKGMTNTGEVKVVYELEHPKFELIKHTPLVKEINCDESIESQIISYFDDIDKKDIMHELDLYAILDYEIYIKPEELLIKMVDTYINNTQVKIDIVACYSRMKEVIEDLPVEKQFRILSSALTIGYEAKSEAYEKIIEMLRSPEEYFGEKYTKSIADIKRGAYKRING